MKRTETIEAIEKLIKKYKLSLKKEILLGSLATCPLCRLPKKRDDGGPDCVECINNVFVTSTFDTYPCISRNYNYNLDWHCDKENLIKYWTSVKVFLTPLEEEIEIADIKDSILKLAEPFKK